MRAEQHANEKKGVSFSQHTIVIWGVNTGGSFLAILPEDEHPSARETSRLLCASARWSLGLIYFRLTLSFEFCSVDGLPPFTSEFFLFKFYIQPLASKDVFLNDKRNS